MTLTDIDGNDWGSLHDGLITRDDITYAIRNASWQYVRKAMKGKSISEKFRICKDFTKLRGIRMDRVAVTNYINALKRAGLVFERGS